MSDTSQHDSLRVIEAGHVDRHYWADLWQYRELFYFLAWRNVKARYKQTAIGVAWVLLRPVLTMVVLTFVFQRVAGLGQDASAPYPLMVLCALLPWQYFAASFVEAGNSLITNSNMISKVYFPRLIVPAGVQLSGLVDFAITLLLLLGLTVAYGQVAGWQILLMPLFLLLGMMLSFGAGVAVAALNVRFRDVRFIIPFVVQFGLFLSPVGFTASEVPAELRWLYDLNPMVGIIEGFRWSLLADQAAPSAYTLLCSVGVSLFLLWAGIAYFRRVEKVFADII